MIAEPTDLIIEAEPTWEIARLFPGQGQWSEEEYLALDTNKLVEFSHGQLEVPPMPTERHQDIVFFLAQMLALFVNARRLGKVLPAPLHIQLWPGKIREPDVVFMSAANAHRRSNRFWTGADLVMEVVSPDDPQRDTVIKRREYAQAGIPEYWIVDPREEQITVLSLDGERYAVHGQFGMGEMATSSLLDGFQVSVTQVFTLE